MTSTAPERDGCAGVALVADDHEVFRLALAAILRDVCGLSEIVPVASFDHAVRTLEDRADIALATIDLGMPGINGPSDLRGLRCAFPKLRLVVVSASERRDDMLTSIAAGAHAYVPKTLATTEMAAAIDGVLAGRIYLPWSVASLKGAHAVETAPDTSLSPGRLTGRQLEVLKLIRSGKSNKEIARVLGLTESTVKVHANALYRALGVRNRVGAASTQLG